MNLKSIIDTHFSEQQLDVILVVLFLMLISVILFLRDKPNLSIFILFLAGLTIRLFAASLDPYLHNWDEQVHAIVAKNMMDHPFKPMLQANPVLPYDFTNWTSNHIWLHKQPWFLWQMALSMKLFGVNEFALRLPMAITLSLLIPVIYRMGTLLVNKNAAWYAAFLYSTSFFFVHHATGWPMLDHNDAAFLVYVTLSLWSWIEFRKSGKRKWIVWIGIFSAIAILNKWLTGLLVYSGWFIAILTTSRGKKIVRALKPLSAALGITVACALPWQIYISYRWPVESRFEYEYNSQHIFSMLGGQKGDSWYYFGQLSEHYGSAYILFFIVPAIFLFMKMIHDKGARYALLTYIFITYLFFTIVATKMPMFTTIVCSLLFLSLGGLLYWLIEELTSKLSRRLQFLILLPVLCILGYANLNITKLDKLHTDQRYNWKYARNNAIINKMASGWLPSSDYVVFNSGGYNAISFMFYNANTAYGFYPGLEMYQDLKKRKIKLATFTDRNLPEYLRRDPEVIKIPLHIQPSPY